MTSSFLSEMDAMTFDDLLARLASKDDVEGLLLLGSIGSAAFSAASDYDLILVLREGCPAIDTVVTWVDGHLTEINCKTIDVLEDLANVTGLRDITSTGVLVSELRVARIAFDRDGRVSELQSRLRLMAAPTLPGEREAYDWWFRIGYSLAHEQRYLSADDATYRLTAEVRLLYGVHDALMAYLAVRGVPWRTDKEAVKYLQTNDLDFLNLLLNCMREPEVSRKIEIYEQLARRALAPVGEPWPRGTTMIELGQVFGEDDGSERSSVAEAQLFWQRLVSAGP